MPDDSPAPEGAPQPTPSQAPPLKKGPGGKIVVMLSSVARTAPGAVPPQAGATLTGPINNPPMAKAKPPPLPVKLPQQVMRAPAPAGSESKTPGNKRTAPIKLNLPSTPAPLPDDSIFLTDDTPEAPAESAPAGWKELAPGELRPVRDDLQSLDVFSRSGPTVETKAPETKSPEVAKAPDLPVAPVRIKPLVHLPPVKAAAPPTTIAPAVVLASPAPISPARPPLLPPSVPMPPASAMTAPLLAPAKPEKKPAISVPEPPPTTLPAAAPQAGLPPLIIKSPAPVEPAPPLLLKADAPAPRKLPPPLPVRKPAHPPEISTKPAEDDNRAKPPALPWKATPQTEKPSETQAAPQSAATLPVDAKGGPPPATASALPTVEAKFEAKPAAGPETPVAAEPPQAPASVTPGAEVEVEVKPGAVTGPILIRDTKPALRPPVLPNRVAREIQEKTVTPVDPSPPPFPAPAPLTPPLLETKPSELEKAAPPTLPSATPSPAPALLTPPLLETKPAEPEKAVPPVLPSITPSPAPSFVVPPLVEAKPAAHEKFPAPALTPDKPTAELSSAAPPLVETKPAEHEKLKPPVKPEEKPSTAKAPPATSPVVKPAGPEKQKISPRADPKLSALTTPAKGPAARKETPDKPAAAATDPALTPRAARARKKRLVSNVFFYTLCLVFGPALYYGGAHFSHETRLEGQVIPPQGMLLGDEAWIVTDFRDEVAREAEDLADKRTPALQDILEKRNHVQRAEADIAQREERVRLLQGQIQSAKQEIDSVIKQAKDAAQQLWSGPGAQIDQDYDAREHQLSQAITDRAKALKLDYQPDPNFNSPEVWANAYRLALYQVPKGVDSSKELLWLGDQMKQWRDFTKSVDDRKEKLREQIAAVKLSPADKVNDLQTQIDDLQHRIDSTTSEETPIKTELQQAQADLAQAESYEDGLDPMYYKQLDSIPESTIIKRLPLLTNGRFHWRAIEKDDVFSGGETAHSYWLFARAIRPDGRQYWALNRITVDQDSTCQLVIEPGAFVSTKAILRPDLPPEEQQ